MEMGDRIPVSHVLSYFIILLTIPTFICGQVLTPPYFNLAKGRNITASATCGVGVPNPELYCRLTGTAGISRGSDLASLELIQGQLCDYCSPNRPDRDHRPEFAIDGTERWWQSPPLSRLGLELNKVNLTISLGQEFHVAYVFIKMANSPRPGVWVLERSVDFGKTYQPWQYFADTPSDCVNFFNTMADQKLTSDDQILCSTQYSKVVPLNNGEIVISLVNDRPSAHNFSYATNLQEWTKATDVRLKLLRTKNLLGHLMAIARQDPTVTRRYYYSIKDISIGGRCVCNGHAETCDTPVVSSNLLLCDCQHNTCGAQCDHCCPGFKQKRWRRALFDQPFECEPCECYGHSDVCIFDDEVETNRLSIDIHGEYEGGGVCQNCSHNTHGNNCEQCVATFYRPYYVPRNSVDACRPCECDLKVSTGHCEEGNGRCLCRPEYAGVNCDRCNFGYYGYPDCIPCDCSIVGTDGDICTVASGNCPCKDSFEGPKCDQCALGYYNYSDCQPCECDPVGSPNTVCDRDSGQCDCLVNFGGMECGECAHGYFNFPRCDYCGCDASGTEEGVCDKETGKCMCKSNYDGEYCDRCIPGCYDFPNCVECQCDDTGSLNPICAANGQCRCKPNYGGMNCDRCAPGFYRYPDCTPCNCDMYGSLSRSCNQVSGQCDCRSNFVGLMCEKCGENFYNYPMCEVCNCNPDGAKELPGFPLGGCGIVTSGLLCECKDKVEGRICDQCMVGHWNLDRNNPEGCEECGCHKPGTLLGMNRCDSSTGQCVCKPNVGGQDCNRCLDGFFSLSEDNPFGCQDCNCDHGGSQQLSCNKMTGQCLCKPRVTGKRCDQPISGHFYPSLHQYKYELEDGTTPEGARVRYDYDSRVFPGFSWRGYAILTSIQPEVLLDVDIRIPSLYQVIYRFVNKENNQVKGTITLTPESPTDITQTGEIVFVSSQEPKFVSVSGAGAVLSFVLNPGRWTISTNVPDNIFLDYFVLIPQAYYEASQIQQKVTKPCFVPNDPGPCVHFGYPDLSGYPKGDGKDGYVIIGTGDERPVAQLPDPEIVAEFGSSGLAHLNETQNSFVIDLKVPDPGLYLIVMTYYNPKDRTQELDVEVATAAGRSEAIATLASCKYSALCRQVLKTEDGKEAIFNISTGEATLYITGREDVDVGIASVFGIPMDNWNPNYILPRIICIKVNGICVPSTYGRPVGAVRIDFEQPPNGDLIAVKPPSNILDPSVGLVNLNDTVKTGLPLELFGRVTKQGQYIFFIHYYMPNEFRLNIPVTVFVDGKISTGVFKPHFCPNVVGCRSTIMFDLDGGKIIKLPETDVRILFNNTKGGQIWLDYLLIVPANQYSGHYLEHLPVDKSGDFLTNCVDEGFQIKDNDQFCREGVFTLTTNFNNGAVDCGCSADGSLSFTCALYAGQCECRDDIIGRTCSVCRPDYFGYPNCQPCSCPYGLCEEDTGDCICPPLVTGEKCDMCEAEAYGYDPLIGCQQCNCHVEGVVDRDLNCDQLTGQCRCKDNIGGRRCDTCIPGYHSFPYCMDCDCERNGTVDAICDQKTSQCLCKGNVEGQYCDQCAEGMFSLSDENPNGCTKCFCFGHTTRCTDAGLMWDDITDMTGWLATNSGDQEVQEAGNTVRVSSLENELDDGVLYWIAPRTYLGRKIMSYGGSLSFTVLFTLPRDKEAEGLVKPDVILTGSNMTIIHFHDSQPAPSTSHTMDVPLLEDNFVHEETNAQVSREQFMMLLSNIDAVLIRASFYTVVGEIRLSDVLMQTATEDGLGGEAETVEMCQCPPNYQGLSCQECSEGYYRVRPTPYLGICTKCNCNGHSNECDVNTGECFNCADNTTGPHCEQCIVGYSGDPTTGGCQICSCPLPVTSNNFATSCYISEDGYTSSCACNRGYTGDVCDSCDAGYYGNPMAKGEYCQSCDCSGNIDMNNPNSCDRFTGVCLLCINNTAGLNCDMCEDWYWGDAIGRKDCQACNCDRCGSQSCEKSIGRCDCKPNVEGPECDKCRANTWGFEMCMGCRECNCGTGSETQQCDLLTGVCTCQPGVEGEKCDRCQAGHWNYGPSGCEQCDCLHDGAVGCDPQSGRCICLPGVTGASCDRCLPRWVLVPGQGCQECDYCIHLLIDDLDFLKQNTSILSRQLGEVSVGIGAFNKLTYYNETVEELRPEVDALSQIDNETFVNMLEPIEADIASLQEDCKENHTKSQNIAFKASQLPDEVQDLVAGAAEAEKLTQDLNIIAKETLKHIEAVRLQVSDSSNSHNLDFFISEGERIAEEIEARNFSSQNESTQGEKANADMALEDVKLMRIDVDMNLNQTASVRKDVEDLRSRLNDLQNSSRYSMADTDSTLKNIQRVRAVQLESLSRNLKTLEEQTKETEDMLKEGKELIMEAEKMLEAAEKSVQGIEIESSRMENANYELENRVNEILEQMDDLVKKTNESWIHASNLAKLAEDMNEMYESTRNISENAVTAGQAYHNILDAVSEASNSSLQALVDAEAAMDESMGSERNVSTSLDEIQEVFHGAEDVYQMATTDTKDKQTDAEDMLMKAEESTMKVREELEEVSKKMDQLDGQSTNGMSDKVMVIVDDAIMKTDEALEGSQEFIDRMADKKDKLKYIKENIPQVNEDMRATKDNTDSAKMSIPEVRDNIDKLTVSADALASTGRQLELNVAALKEKIAQARHEANRIRVGLKYFGNTTVTLRNPPKLEDTGSFTTVSLFFKTLQSDTMLMYVGNNQATSSDENRTKRSSDSGLLRVVRQAVERQSDYIGLEIQGGRVVFTYNLGSGPAVITSDRFVNDGKWHQVICNRIGKIGKLTVKSEEVDDEVQEGTSEGTFTVLELNPITTIYLVGGVPADVKIPGDLSTTFFEGSMEELKFDGEPMGLWNFVDAEYNVEGEKERVVLQEAVPEGTRFSGTGYVVLGKEGLSLRPDRTKVSLIFKTYAEDGLLFYMGNKDYFAIDMHGGRVIFQYDLGGGAAVMETSDVYNDGMWHRVTIDRNRRRAVLIIDDGLEKINAESKGSLNNLETTNNVYLGGVDNVKIPSSNVVSAGFDGCMKGIVIGTLSVDVSENKRAKGIIKGCTPKVTHAVSFPTSKGAYIALKSVNIGSMFDVTFKFKTSKTDGLLAYSSDDSQVNTFAVSLREGHIVVTEELGSRSSELSSRINTYGDAEWHYVSIMKMGQTLTMSIDDFEMVETESVEGELLTTTPLYFGGLPYSYQVTSKALNYNGGAEGCMGDITVNKKFQNLAHTPREGISFAECTVEKSKKPIINPNLKPDQCALPSIASDFDTSEANVEGVRFGATPYSRQEFKKLPVRMRIKPIELAISFKTTGDRGVLFYTSDKGHTDFLGVYLVNGQVHYGFNCGSGAALIVSPDTYNDGEWHTVKVSRRNQLGTLEVDNIRVGAGKSRGGTRSLNTKPPYFLGGLPEESRKKAMGNLGDTNVGFVGCMKDVTINMLPFQAPSEEVHVQPCADSVESGTFVGINGGHVKLYDTFKVGRDLDITMDIKPRTKDGVLLAVHRNKGDFILLQLSDGEVILSTDNGAGIITTSLKPEESNAFCDGQWHNIQASKKKHVVTLSVNGRPAPSVEGKAGVSSADTKNPLFVGGLEDPAAKGVVANGTFVGCIRNLYLNGKLEYIATGTADGDVRLDACPKA